MGYFLWFETTADELNTPYVSCLHTEHMLPSLPLKLTCVSALVRLQVRALRVNLATPVEVTPVHPSPGVWGCVPAEGSSLFCSLPRCSPDSAAGPHFDRQVQAGVRGHPAVHRRGGADGGLRRRRRGADDRGAKRSGADQDGPQRVGCKAVRGGELLKTVRSFTAGIRVHAVGVQDLVVLIVLLEGWGQVRVRLSFGLVAAG